MNRYMIASVIAAIAVGAYSSIAKTAVTDSGLASYYGPGLYGNHVACSGVSLPSSYRLWTGSFGVANRYLKCGTKLTICYNGRCAYTTVIDRGPYVYSRTFDLTAALAAYLCRCDAGVWGVRTVTWSYR